MIDLVYDILAELEREDNLRRELFDAAVESLEDLEVTEETVRQYDPDRAGGWI
jgi:hypothetical protein